MVPIIETEIAELLSSFWTFKFCFRRAYIGWVNRALPAFYFPPSLCFSCDFSMLAAGVRNAFCSFHSRKCARQFGSWKFWKIPPQKTNCLDLWKCCYWWQFWFWSSPSLQLNEYETVPYFLQLSQNLTSDCFLISVYLSVFTSFCMMFWSAEQSYDHIMQKQVKTQKSTNNPICIKFRLK